MIDEISPAAVSRSCGSCSSAGYGTVAAHRPTSCPRSGTVSVGTARKIVGEGQYKQEHDPEQPAEATSRTSALARARFIRKVASTSSMMAAINQVERRIVRPERQNADQQFAARRLSRMAEPGARDFDPHAGCVRPGTQPQQFERIRNRPPRIFVPTRPTSCSNGGNRRLIDTLARCISASALTLRRRS